jgi:hypothetical protein
MAPVLNAPAVISAHYGVKRRAREREFDGRDTFTERRLDAITEDVARNVCDGLLRGGWGTGRRRPWSVRGVVCCLTRRRRTRVVTGGVRTPIVV